jgi:hypothetical protein
MDRRLKLLGAGLSAAIAAAPVAVDHAGAHRQDWGDWGMMGQGMMGYGMGPMMGPGMMMGPVRE